MIVLSNMKMICIILGDTTMGDNKIIAQVENVIFSRFF